MASEDFHRKILYLILIITPFIIYFTIFFGERIIISAFGITQEFFVYVIFEQSWTTLLTGINPYIGNLPYLSPCPYPIGFLGFGGFYYIYNLLPKVIFCLAWIYTGILLNNICKKHNITAGSTVFFSLGFIVLNPLYFSLIMIQGWFDSVVGLCVLLAVYYIDNAEQIKSGIYSSLSFLFKFIGLIIIFPIIFIKKKINWRVGVVVISICGGLYLVGYFLWGTYVFAPFEEHLFRAPAGSSIVEFISDVMGVDLSNYIVYLLIIGLFIVIIVLYLHNTDISSFTLICIIGFLLVIPVFFANYLLWFLPLAMYWSITHKYALKRTIILYFSVMAIITHLYDAGDYIPELWFTAYFSLMGVIISAIFALLIYFNRKKQIENVEV